MKWLLRYLKFTVNKGLVYKGCKAEIELVGYVDSDYVGDRDKIRFISSDVF